MPATNLRPFQTYLEPKDKKKLEQIARKDGRSGAAMARKIIEDYLRKH